MPASSSRKLPQPALRKVRARVRVRVGVRVRVRGRVSD